MGKVRVLQVLSIMLFLVGGYILYEALIGERLKISVISGIGPIIMGVALLIISMNPKIRNEKE